MTDKTDIEALREECAQWVKGNFGDLIDTRMAKNGDGNDYMSWDMEVIWRAWRHLSGKLEAERQRADKAESYARERDSENESIALTVGRLRLELAKLSGKLETPIVIPPRKTAKDYVDDEFSNADLAAIYNAARLELKAKIKNAGFTTKDGE